MTTCLHEMADGTLVEYRRRPHPAALLLECRVLRPDGRPYQDGWYPVSDRELLRLQIDGSDIVSLPAG